MANREIELEAENERSRSVLKVVVIPEGGREKYYPVEKYMRHVDGCPYDTD